MTKPTKIVIELEPKEAEVLCGALASHTPADKSHEAVIYKLYALIRRKYDEFLQM